MPSKVLISEDGRGSMHDGGSDTGEVKAPGPDAAKDPKCIETSKAPGDIVD